MAREQIDGYGLSDEEPFSGFNHYSFHEEDDDPARYLATSTRRAIKTLDGTIDGVSLVIRYQRSLEIASGYLRALDDIGADQVHPIGETEDGFFTPITRPTNPTWPGPLIIYCVDSVPANNLLGRDSWSVAITITIIERFLTSSMIAETVEQDAAMTDSSATIAKSSIRCGIATATRGTRSSTGSTRGRELRKKGTDDLRSSELERVIDEWMVPLPQSHAREHEVLDLVDRIVKLLGDRGELREQRGGWSLQRMTTGTRTANG